MNRQSFTEHMEKCALAAEAQALAATELATAAGGLSTSPPEGPSVSATAINDRVHTLDVAAGMHNAAEVDNGAGLLTQSALWITPQTRVYYMPLLSR